MSDEHFTRAPPLDCRLMSASMEIDDDDEDVILPDVDDEEQDVSVVEDEPLISDEDVEDELIDDD